MAGRGTPATALVAKQKIAHTVHEYAHDPRAESYGAEAADALAAVDRRLRWTHQMLGLGPVGIAIPTPRIFQDPESPAASGSRPGSASRKNGPVV